MGQAFAISTIVPDLVFCTSPLMKSGIFATIFRASASRGAGPSSSGEDVNTSISTANASRALSHPVRLLYRTNKQQLGVRRTAAGRRVVCFGKPGCDMHLFSLPSFLPRVMACMKGSRERVSQAQRLFFQLHQIRRETNSKVGAKNGGRGLTKICCI